MNTTRRIATRMLKSTGGTEKLAELVCQTSFVESLQKWAQEGGLASALEGIATPALFGIGGYAASRQLGLGRYFGLPDEIVGPAIGLGAVMPAVRMARDYLRKRREEDAMQEMTQEEMDRLERQFALEEQAQNLLSGVGTEQLNALGRPSW